MKRRSPSAVEQTTCRRCNFGPVTLTNGCAAETGAGACNGRVWARRLWIASRTPVWVSNSFGEEIG